MKRGVIAMAGGAIAFLLLAAYGIVQQPRRDQSVRAAALAQEVRRLKAVLQHGYRLAKVS